MLAARDAVSSAPALETLSRAYWYPLYAHVRRRGYDHHAAQDLTQEFFARLFERQWLGSVGPEKGRFRTFLLCAMDHLLANDWRDGRAAKRGAGQTLLPLEETKTGEERFGCEPASDAAPERVFDKSWAIAVLGEALRLLEQDFAGRGKAAQFQEWKVFLTRPATAQDCAASGQRLGMSAGAVTVAVHRLRERYGDLLRETVSHTVAAAADVDDELRYLFLLLNE